MVASVAQELVDDVAIRAMDLHAVQAGLPGPRGGVLKLGDEPRDFTRLECPRGDEVLHAIIRHGLPCRPQGGRRDGQCVVWLQARVGNSSAMLELKEDASARRAHRIGHAQPTRHLRVREDSGGEGIADRLRRNWHRLRDDEARGGSLLVIGRHQRQRDAVSVGAISCQRCHHHAVGERQVTKLKRVEQVGRHAGFPLGDGKIDDSDERPNSSLGRLSK
jgi:hypothetical protein